MITPEELLQKQLTNLKEHYRQVSVLLAEDICFYGGFTKNDDGTITNENPELEIMCNDIFVPAADAEPLPYLHVNTIYLLYKHFGWEGVIAWVALRRDDTPQWGVKMNKAKYRDAKNFIAKYNLITWPSPNLEWPKK